MVFVKLISFQHLPPDDNVSTEVSVSCLSVRNEIDMTSAGVSICPSRNCEAADRFLRNLV